MAPAQRTLTLFDNVALLVGVIVGAGIFETPGPVAAAMGSPSGVIAVWILGGVVSLAGALCYADLASAYPEEGGDAVYYRRAFGGVPAWLFLWARFAIIQPGSLAALAFTFSRWF